MPRRSKADAQLTRERILDAAEHAFLQAGVSRTSLEQIAQRAGVTRGAVYFHFRDKADLFNAMLNRVTLPLEQQIRLSGDRQVADPVAQVRRSFVAALKATVEDPQVRRVIEITLHRVEHTPELQGVRERRLRGHQRRVADIERGFRRAARQGDWRPAVSARVAALGVHALVDGLIQDWLLDPQAFNLLSVGRQAIDAYLRGCQAGPDLHPPVV